MAPIAKQTGEADTEHGAIEPGLLFCGLRHEEAVYKRQSIGNNAEGGSGVLSAFKRGLTRRKILCLRLKLAKMNLNVFAPCRGF
jgi:hypothetical protein